MMTWDVNNKPPGFLPPVTAYGAELYQQYLSQNPGT